MNGLVRAINSNERTENGMVTNASSLSACVDLFFTAGAKRGKDIIPNFSKAMIENPEVATRIALWARDVRGGAGERQIFRDILKYLIENTSQARVESVARKIPELGRWDDLFVLMDTPMEHIVYDILAEGITNPDTCGLVCKWLPRKGPIANKLRKWMKCSPKEYRQFLVANTKVVEQSMCAKEWSDIKYASIPSLAHSRYMKAFWRNDAERYGAYVESLKKGETKINASAVYPYDITKALKYGDKHVANEQWKALPDYCADSKERIIPIVDVSGSMCLPAGGNKNVRCLDVALSLGLYLSERLKGEFNNYFITFSDNPQLVHVTGTLSNRLEQMEQSNWGMSTNLESVFKLILSSALKNNVSADEMPTVLLILSDMEFNRCCGDPSDSAMRMIQKKYEAAGYVVPKVVFWNIQSRSNKNVPVEYNAKGTALVSGFSPSIMTSILKNVENLTPERIMFETINNDRYNF
jgi:hypothetical protein